MLLLFSVFCLGTLQSTKSSKQFPPGTGFEPGTKSDDLTTELSLLPRMYSTSQDGGLGAGGGGGGGEGRGVSGVGGGKTLNLLFGTACIYTVWGQPPELGGG